MTEAAQRAYPGGMTIAAKRELLFPAIVLALFWGYGLFMYGQTQKPFFLFDLPYIGSSIAAGSLLNAFLPRPRRHLGRIATQFLIGAYMVGFLGFGMRVNMQVEQFLFLLFSWQLGGAVVHYLPAKLLGPLVFGRGWCGWGCWTASVLDLLPFKRNPAGRRRRWGLARYAYLGLAALLIGIAVARGKKPPAGAELLAWFAAGNAAYWLLGLALAVALRDNRAFCKYLCPIPPLQKILGRFALFKMRVDPAACVRCGRCDASCPMDVELTAYLDHEAGRVDSTECILCTTCAQVCPKQAVALKPGRGMGRVERLRFRGR